MDNVNKKLAERFWTEFMDAAELDMLELSKCDPQEMALFGFLVGAGMKWDEARKIENWDIYDFDREWNKEADERYGPELIKEQQEIVDAYNRGEAIEYRNKGIGNSQWTSALPFYLDWEVFEYRLEK